MSLSPIDFEKRSVVDEKNVDQISNDGIAVTVAEDTVEAAHECTQRLLSQRCRSNSY
jgi:hypothetical protein